MTTPSQQALAAFIDSAEPPLKWEWKHEGEANWKIPFSKAIHYCISRPGNQIRLVPGQLNDFLIPHSLAHLIHNPAGLTAAQITEGGKYRIALTGSDNAVEKMEFWDGFNGWRPFSEFKGSNGWEWTYRLPALHPLPEVESKTKTFEAHGHTWTKHTPGDPMPCEGERKVIILMDNETDSRDCDETTAGKAKHWGWCKGGGIICWRDLDTPPQAEVKQSETPRTDAAATILVSTDPVTYDMHGLVNADFARTLERELAAERKRAEDAEAQIVALREAIRERVEAKEEYDSTPNVTSLRCGKADSRLKAILSAQPPAVKEEQA